MDIARLSLELTEKCVPFCLLTVVRVEGSAPRHAGSKMIFEAGGRTHGTIGGGGVEHRAVADATSVLARHSPECIRYDLTEDGIQPCGGTVEIFFEPVLPKEPLVFFGAGHVAEKLVPMLVELGFAVTLVDERAERLALPSFSAAHAKVNLMPQDFIQRLEFTDDLHLVCMTHKHVHDEDIVGACLGKKFKYLGLISSRKKWELFKTRFRERGFTDEMLSRVATPVGLDLGAETPFEIAIAVAAELIQMRARPADFAAGLGHFPKAGVR